MKRKFLRLGLLSLSTLLAVACQNEIVENQTTATFEKTNLPVGFKPIKVGLTANPEMQTTLQVDATMENGSDNLTRAIGAHVDKGTLTFKFNEETSNNMLVILRKKDTEQIIYLQDVTYKGDANGKFRISLKNAKGFAKNITSDIKKNEENWYAMFIYDNPIKQDQNKAVGEGRYGYFDKSNLTMPVGSVSNNKRTTIFLVDKGEQNAIIDKAVEIPFVSTWVPVNVVDDNSFASSTSVSMKPQGVLMRFDIENKSAIDCKINAIEWETNVLHSNIK